MATKENDILKKVVEFITRSKLRKAIKTQNGNLERDMRVLDHMVQLLKPDREE